MNVHFSVAKFRRTRWQALGQYLESTLPPDRPPAATDVEALLRDIDTLPELHRTYVIIWAAQLGLPGAADAALVELARCTDRGGQLTLTRVLSQCADLTAAHVEAAERLAAADDHWMLQEGARELRAAWDGRTAN